MSNPTLITGYGQFYYLCDRDPTSTENDQNNNGCYVNIPDFKYAWFNTNTGELFWCFDNTQNAMVWKKVINNSNLSDAISTLGFNINTSRSYALRSSPAFNTAYTPSSTNDVLVVAVVNCTSTIVTPGTVLFQLNTISGYVNIGEFSVSGVAASNFGTITCLVPVNTSYKLLNSSGSATIVSLNEIEF